MPMELWYRDHRILGGPGEEGPMRITEFGADKYGTKSPKNGSCHAPVAA
jgi:hypothetical protein